MMKKTFFWSVTVVVLSVAFGNIMSYADGEIEAPGMNRWMGNPYAETRFMANGFCCGDEGPGGVEYSTLGCNVGASVSIFGKHAHAFFNLNASAGRAGVNVRGGLTTSNEDANESWENINRGQEFFVMDAGRVYFKAGNDLLNHRGQRVGTYNGQGQMDNGHRVNGRIRHGRWQIEQLQCDIEVPFEGSGGNNVIRIYGFPVLMDFRGQLTGEANFIVTAYAFFDEDDNIRTETTANGYFNLSANGVTSVTVGRGPQGFILSTEIEMSRSILLNNLNFEFNDVGSGGPRGSGTVSWGNTGYSIKLFGFLDGAGFSVPWEEVLVDTGLYANGVDLSDLVEDDNQGADWNRGGGWGRYSPHEMQAFKNLHEGGFLSDKWYDHFMEGPRPGGLAMDVSLWAFLHGGEDGVRGYWEQWWHDSPEAGELWFRPGGWNGTLSFFEEWLRILKEGGPGEMAAFWKRFWQLLGMWNPYGGKGGVDDGNDAHDQCTLGLSGPGYIAWNTVGSYPVTVAAPCNEEGNISFGAERACVIEPFINIPHGNHVGHVWFNEPSIDLTDTRRVYAVCPIHDNEPDADVIVYRLDIDVGLPEEPSPYDNVHPNPPYNEMDPGLMIPRVQNESIVVQLDGTKVPTYYDNLVPVTITLSPAGLYTGALELNAEYSGTGRFKMWKNADRTEEVFLPYRWDVSDSDAWDGADPRGRSWVTFYLDGTITSSVPGDITIELSCVDVDDEGNERYSCADKANVTVYEIEYFDTVNTSFGYDDFTTPPTSYDARDSLGKAYISLTPLPFLNFCEGQISPDSIYDYISFGSLGSRVGVRQLARAGNHNAQLLFNSWVSGQSLIKGVVDRDNATPGFVIDARSYNEVEKYICFIRVNEKSTSTNDPGYQTRAMPYPSSVQYVLNDVYHQAVVKWYVSAIPNPLKANFDLDGDFMLDTDAWTTPEMDVIINKFKSTTDYPGYRQDNHYYIFVVDYPLDQSWGMMPIGGEFGFVHPSQMRNSSNSLDVTYLLDFGRTAAHELGHGQGGRHADKEDRDGDGIEEIKPYPDYHNLMCSAPFDTKLRVDQWNLFNPSGHNVLRAPSPASASSSSEVLDIRKECSDQLLRARSSDCDPLERQQLVEVLVEYADHPSSLIRNMVLTGLCDLKDAFSETAKTALRDNFNIDSRMILLAGLVGLKGEAHETIKSLAAAPLLVPEVGYYYGTPEWAARIVEAAKGDKAGIKSVLETIDAEENPVIKVAVLLDYLKWIQHPKTVNYLKQYLNSDKNLPSSKADIPGTAYAGYAAQVLAQMLEGFPFSADKASYAYTFEDIDAARRWINQDMWQFRTDDILKTQKYAGEGMDEGEF